MGRNCARALENGTSPPGARNQITGFTRKPDRKKINTVIITLVEFTCGSLGELGIFNSYSANSSRICADS